MVMHPNVAVVVSIPRDRVHELLALVGPEVAMAVYMPEADFEQDPIETIQQAIAFGDFEPLT
jgi:hypothetical protein